MWWDHELCQIVNKNELTNSSHQCKLSFLIWESCEYRLTLSVSSIGQWITRYEGSVQFSHLFWDIFCDVWWIIIINVVESAEINYIIWSYQLEEAKWTISWILIFFQNGIDLCLLHAILWTFYNKIYKIYLPKYKDTHGYVKVFCAKETVYLHYLRP